MPCNSSGLVIESLLKVICLTERDRNRAVCHLRRCCCICFLDLLTTHRMMSPEAELASKRGVQMQSISKHIREPMRRTETSLQLWQPQKHGVGVRHPSVCGIQAFLNNSFCWTGDSNQADFRLDVRPVSKPSGSDKHSQLVKM